MNAHNFLSEKTNQMQKSKKYIKNFNSNHFCDNQYSFAVFNFQVFSMTKIDWFDWLLQNWLEMDPFSVMLWLMELLFPDLPTVPYY